MPAIEVESLTIKYGSTIAVDRLDFEADVASLSVILGPNGAGKSSTVEALEGFRKLSSGQVRVLGLEPHRQQRELGRVMGVMLQQGGVNPRMTPRFALRLFHGYYADALSADELLEKVELRHVADTAFRRLSGGEKQRLLLALAIIGKPKIAFLDEPTSGVDPSGRVVIREIISELRARGTCVVMTTHELNEAEKLADQLLIIASGKSLFYGSVDRLKREAGGARISFSTTVPLDESAISAEASVRLRRTSASTYEVIDDPNPQLMARLTSYLAAHDIDYRDLSSSEKTLEEIYLEIVGADREDNKIASEEGEVR